MTHAHVGSVVGSKPRPAEIDVFGLTHAGKVRSTNADHFIVASFYRAMRVHGTSLTDELPALSTYSRGYLFLVADGVGGLANAESGSARTALSIAQHVLDMAEIGTVSQPDDDERVLGGLRSAVMEAHESLLDMGTGRDAATTLTMWLALWPRAFLIHAGDSRCYRLRDGRLARLTVDQTMEQAMIEAGAVASGSAQAERLRHILLSALGSSQVELHVGQAEVQRNDRMLLCTDGLTRYVDEAEIQEHMAGDAGSEAICKALLQLALDRGGADNITAIMGQASAQDGS